MRRHITNISYMIENLLIFVLKVTFFYSLFALVPWYVIFKVLQLFFGAIPFMVNAVIFFMLLLMVAYYFEKNTSLLDMPLYRHIPKKVLMRTHSHYTALSGFRKKYLAEYLLVFAVPFLIVTYFLSLLFMPFMLLFYLYLFVSINMMLCFFFSYLAKASGRKRRIYDLSADRLSLMDYHFRPVAGIDIEDIKHIQIDEKKKVIGVRAEEEFYVFPSRFKEFAAALLKHAHEAKKETKAFSDYEAIEKKDHEMDS